MWLKKEIGVSKTYIDESLPRTDAGERHGGVVWLVLAAMALALPGLSLLVVGQGSANTVSSTPLIGIGLAVGSGFVYATFAILSKIATRRSVPGPQVVAIAFTTGAFLLFPAALMSGGL